MTTVREQVAAQVEAKGYASCILMGFTIHAATSVTPLRTPGNFAPRPLCQRTSRNFFAGLIEDQTTEVTCKRCIASLNKALSRAA